MILPLLAKIKKEPLMFDGAMGTMIYQNGVFLNTCYDELCLKNPELILRIHREYVAAGVDVIETNTFGANRLKLAGYGLANLTKEINTAAVKLAREAVQGTDVYIGASVGPCLKANEAFTLERQKDLQAAFAEQISVFASEKTDLIVLETFYNLPELKLAAETAARYDLPVLASFVPPQAADTDLNDCKLIAWIKDLNVDQNIDLIGLNCGLGPAEIFESLRTVLRYASKPVVVMPNAGGGKEVGGRMLYLNSPEYFTEYAKRYIQLGARGVGGCCGTTPAHLRMAVRAVKTLTGVKEHLRIVSCPSASLEEKVGVSRKLMAEKSALGAKLAAGKPVNLVEILPPRSAGGLPDFLAKCTACKHAGIDAVNLPDGPRASARISVIIAAMLAQNKTGMECLPHYCCRDRNLIGMQADLLGGQAAGLRNWLLITGDPPKLGNYPDATGVFDLDAVGLCRLANNLNSGYDAAGCLLLPPTDFLVGVGANPVAIDLDREIEHFYAKIDAGADFAITQPVFDVEALLKFLDRISSCPTQIPIIAGCYPLTSLRNAEFMNQHVPGVVVPETVLKRMALCTTKEEGLNEGILIAREIREQLAGKVQGLQVSAPLGNVEAALRVF